MSYRRTPAYRRQPDWWANPTYRYLIFTFGPALLLAILIAVLAQIHLVWGWLIALTLVTFIAYGYDKTIARIGSLWMRVPERVLLALGFLGGTAGALLGMAAFHHKTIKPEFRVQFWILVGVQVVIVAALVVLLRR